MKQTGLLLLGLAALSALLVATGCGSTKTVTKTVTVSETAKSGVGSPREVVEYGFIKSLERKGATFELRFDPAWLLTGKTANQAALEDTGSSDVPNDNYVVNESTRAYTFIVSPSAHVTVLKEGVNGSAITSAPRTRASSTAQRRAFFDGSEPSMPTTIFSITGGIAARANRPYRF